MTPTILCVLFDGAKYSPDFAPGEYDEGWVDRLYRGVRDNAEGVDFDFICLHDGARTFGHKGIRGVPLRTPSEGWMNLLEVFRPDLGVERGVMFGLDTIIAGPIGDLLQWRGPFGACRSPMAHGQLCNAVLSFGRPEANRLWSIWIRNRPRWRRICSSGLGPSQNGRPSEVLFLRWNRRPNWTMLDSLFPISSYKIHPDRHETSSIIYFHGSPRPSEIDGPPRLVEAWR